MKALIIVDMQNDFLTGPLGNEHCRAAIPGVVDLIKQDNWDVIVATKDTHDPEKYRSSLEGQKLPIDHCFVNTDGWKIDNDIENALQKAHVPDWVVWLQKPTFGSLDLPNAIAHMYETQAKCQIGRGRALELHFCGVCTSICVLANVVICRAAFPDAKIVVHTEACGDVTKEMHEAAKICFASQQCEVL